jgi:hypothetical protein
MDDKKFADLILNAVEPSDRPTLSAMLGELQSRNQVGFMALKRGVQEVLRKANKIPCQQLATLLDLPENATDRDILLAIGELKAAAVNSFSPAIQGIIEAAAAVPIGEIAPKIVEGED